MKIPLNCSAKFSTLHAIFRASWAAWLVSLLVGIWFPARAVADIITLPDPYYTNQFTTVEAWVELDTVTAKVLTPEQCTNFVGDIRITCDQIRYYCDFYLWEIYYFIEGLGDYFQDFEENADWPSDVSDQFVQDYEDLRIAVYERARSFQLSAYEQMRNITNEVGYLEYVADELESLPYTNVIRSVSFGQEFGYTQGGSCHCPDYTVYLTGLQSDLTAIRADLNNLVFSVARAAISQFGSASGLGEAIGDKYLFLRDFLNGILGNLSFVDEDSEDFGQRVAELGYTLSLVQRGAEEDLRYYNVASNLYAHLIDGWCFPTNVEERPLWVTFDQVALRGLLDDVLGNASIKVSVTNALKVSVTNELQIAVTNDIHVVNDVSQEVMQIQNNMSEIEDLAGNLHVDEVAEITDEIVDRTHLFDGWDTRIRQFPERFQNLWDTQYELPPDIVIYDGYSAVVRSGGFNGWGSGSRRSRAAGDEEILTVDTLRLEIGPNADTASGRWIYRIATACHNVTNVVWSLLFLAILVKLFKIDIFLLRSSCFIFLAWLSALGVGGMRRLSIMEAMAQSFDRIAKLFTSMFGDGGEDAA